MFRRRWIRPLLSVLHRRVHPSFVCDPGRWVNLSAVVSRGLAAIRHRQYHPPYISTFLGSFVVQLFGALASMAVHRPFPRKKGTKATAKTPRSPRIRCDSLAASCTSCRRGSFFIPLSLSGSRQNILSASPHARCRNAPSARRPRWRRWRRGRCLALWTSRWRCGTSASSCPRHWSQR